MKMLQFSLQNKVKSACFVIYISFLSACCICFSFCARYFVIISHFDSSIIKGTNPGNLFIFYIWLWLFWLHLLHTSCLCISLIVIHCCNSPLLKQNHRQIGRMCQKRNKLRWLNICNHNYLLPSLITFALL